VLVELVGGRVEQGNGGRINEKPPSAHFEGALEGPQEEEREDEVLDNVGDFS